MDFPAPFSPMIPVMEPWSTAMSMSRLAWTAPKRLLIPRSSTAGGADPSPAAGLGSALSARSSTGAVRVR